MTSQTHYVVYQELKLPAYKGQSPQLNLRRYFADLIAIVSNHLRLCPAARHLAVYLLDLFMDRYDVTVQQLHMVSLSCLILASKFGSDYHGLKTAPQASETCLAPTYR